MKKHLPDSGGEEQKEPILPFRVGGLFNLYNYLHWLIGCPRALLRVIKRSPTRILYLCPFCGRETVYLLETNG